MIWIVSRIESRRSQSSAPRRLAVRPRDEQPAVVHEDAPDLMEHGDPWNEVLDDIQAEDIVEGGIAEREWRGRVTANDVHHATSRRYLRVTIHGDDLTRSREDTLSMDTGPTAKIKHTATAAYAIDVPRMRVVCRHQVLWMRAGGMLAGPPRQPDGERLAAAVQHVTIPNQHASTTYHRVHKTHHED